MNIKDCVSRNLKKYRKLRNLKQDELAELCDVTKQLISNIESRKTFPSASTIEALSRALEITETQLFFDESLKITEDEMIEFIVKKIRK